MVVATVLQTISNSIGMFIGARYAFILFFAPCATLAHVSVCSTSYGTDS